MPTITVGDLQRLIESVSYERFAREKVKDAIRPPSWNPARARPSSAPRLRSSSPKDNRVKTRPQSAKPHVNQSELDYTGLTNMMQGVKLSKKKWIAKSDNNLYKPDTPPQHTDTQTFKNLESSFVQNRALDHNKLRKSRASSYSRFRYPLQMHMAKYKETRQVLEQKIPPSLRRFPHYTNQPLRQDCNYNPPVRPVTKVKSHVIRSNSLPNVALAKAPTPPKTSKPVVTQSVTEQEAEARDRNGNFHYVYQGPPTTFLTPGEDTHQQSSQIITQATPRITDEEFDSVNDLSKHLEDMDNYSDVTDDMYQTDAICDVGSARPTDRSEGEADDKRSYGDINDLLNADDIPDDVSIHSAISDAESIPEEDIPEFTAARAPSRPNVQLKQMNVVRRTVIHKP